MVSVPVEQLPRTLPVPVRLPYNFFVVSCMQQEIYTNSDVIAAGLKYQLQSTWLWLPLSCRQEARPLIHSHWPVLSY